LHFLSGENCKKKDKDSKKEQTSAEEHAKRFIEKYKNLPIDEDKYLLVDFRPRKYAPYTDYQHVGKNDEWEINKIFLKNFWIVIYENDYSTLTIARYNERAEFDGIDTITLLPD